MPADGDDAVTGYQIFEQADAEKPPPKKAIVFVGSSSIRKWDLRKSFPDLKTINRGFGGSQIEDSTHFSDRIVTKHEPRVIVLYAGDNDIARGKSPKQVHADFQAFVKKVHASLRETKIVYIGIKPSIARWKLVDKMRQANTLIQSECKPQERLVYVDVETPMIGRDGRPRADLFAADGLHLSAKGYTLWTKLVRPHVVTLHRD